MAETVEALQSQRSKLPLAMIAAFVVGAGVAGWFMFKEDIQEWTRSEDFAWTLASGEVLTLYQAERIDREGTGQSVDILRTDLTWTITPSGDVRVPGETAIWTQRLDAARVQRRIGEHDQIVTLPPDAQGPGVHVIDDGPPWVDLLAPVLGLDLHVRLEGVAARATSTTAEANLEEFTTRRTEKRLEVRGALDDAATAALHEELGWFAQSAAVDLAGWAAADLYRPGQTWTRELSIDVGEWGAHDVRLEVRLEGFDGDHAKLSAQITRASVDAALSADDGLSGLKGTAAWQVDVAAGRVAAGRMDLEARGKTSRKFATLRIHRAFALAGPGETPSLPVDWAPASIPPLPEDDTTE